jgi:hypothetical protein
MEISECGLRIADLKHPANPIFQSAIRNLKSAIDFTPMLHNLLMFKGTDNMITY